MENTRKHSTPYNNRSSTVFDLACNQESFFTLHCEYLLSLYCVFSVNYIKTIQHSLMIVFFFPFVPNKYSSNVLCGECNAPDERSWTRSRKTVILNYSINMILNLTIPRNVDEFVSSIIIL